MLGGRCGPTDPVTGPLLREFFRRERLKVLVLFRLGWPVLLADPVQPCLLLLGRQRVAVQPGEILVSPRVPGTGDRDMNHHPFGRKIVLSNMIA
jgi:hypothetical protein